MKETAIRPPRADEVAAVADLLNEISQHLHGVADTTADELGTWFTSPDVDPERDIRVAELDGHLVGYGDVSAWGGKAWFDIREHPRLGDGAVAKALLDSLVPRAKELVAGNGGKTVLRAWTPTAQTAVKDVLEHDGFSVIRLSFRMEIDLRDDLPEPRWPDGVTVRTFEPDRDEEVVYAVQNEGFADMWEYVPSPYEEWLHFMRNVSDFDPSLWFLASDGDEVVGVALCRPHEPGDPELGWVRVLAVRPDWRRRGIGGALLQHAFAEFRRRGLPRAGLGVDGESTTGAIELYERAGMRVVRRGETLEKTLAS